MDPAVESVAVRMCEAMAEADVAALRSLYAEDMRLMHMTGMVQTGEEFLSGIADGTMRYHGVTVVSVEGESDGRTADVVLRTLTDASVFGGPRHTWRLESRLRMRNGGDGWRIFESSVTTF